MTTQVPSSLKPALVIIYNHNYPRNIERIEWLYKGRFSKVVHIIPFYNGRKENVIPVYENSHYFSGYVAQAYRRLELVDCDSFLFIADDMILNPCINQSNTQSILNVDQDTSFISAIQQFHKCESFWMRCRDAIL